MDRWRWAGLGAIVIFIIIVIWCRVFKCPLCRPCPQIPATGTGTTTSAPASIVLDNHHTAVWMPLDNGFAPNSAETPLGDDDTKLCADPAKAEANCDASGGYADSDAGDLRAGLLFQLGKTDLGSGFEPLYDGVTLTLSDDTNVVLGKNDFDWLDVRAMGTKCVLDAFHAYALFTKLNPATSKPFVTTVCDGLVLDSEKQSCLRNRSIHANYKPESGIVTYWTSSSTGSSMYSMEMMEKGATLPLDYEYRFDLKHAVGVDLWKNGCLEQHHDNVKKVQIRHPLTGGTDEDGYPNPPMDGGKFGLPP
jgi:hypothetical protein